MANRAETGQIERVQAALEAVEVLNRAGFNVHDFGVETDPMDYTFDLNASLSVGENERPLEALE